MEDWNSPIYAFFLPVPEIVSVGGRRAHEFRCLTKGCKQKIQCFLDTSDAKSTSNLHWHVKSCWGEDVFNAIKKLKDVAAAREGVKKYAANGSIAAFARKNGDKKTFSSRLHTKTETR